MKSSHDGGEDMETDSRDKDCGSLRSEAFLFPVIHHILWGEPRYPSATGGNES
jgi:hypothetical protein